MKIFEWTSGIVKYGYIEMQLNVNPPEDSGFILFLFPAGSEKTPENRSKVKHKCYCSGIYAEHTVHDHYFSISSQ